jgi:hypothetical protein
MGDDVRGALGETWGPSSREAFATAVQHFDRFLAEELANPDDGAAMANLLFGPVTPEKPSYELAQKHKIIDESICKIPCRKSTLAQQRGQDARVHDSRQILELYQNEDPQGLGVRGRWVRVAADRC